ncbi:MAG: biopolymer transporter ExbD [Burkholderiaceae bacterium]
MSQPLSFSRPHRKSAVVSLTPLIDVVFMLLLFFMLATRFDGWRSIELSAGSDQLAPTDPDRHFLRLRVSQAQLTLAGEVVSLAQVAQRLAQLPSSTRLVVEPADDVPLQRLVTVMDELATAGIDRPIVSID